MSTANSMVVTEESICATVEPMTNTSAWLMPKATPTAPRGRNCATTERNRMPMSRMMIMMVMGSISAMSLVELASMSAEMAAPPVT